MTLDTLLRDDIEFSRRPLPGSPPLAVREREELERIIALPKSHPLRFHTLYCRSAPEFRASIREAQRMLWWFRCPFSQDLEAVTSTNS